ncbi:MAG: 50S ribosomal protein L22 [bacterium]|nr:50S ribosomal protein L22 [bacterium]
MEEVKAKLSYHRIAPRKARLVAGLVRGKKVDEALAQLMFLGKRSAPAIAKLLKSALSNAKNNHKIDTEKTNLYIKEIKVDEGPSYKRWKPVWRGMAHPFKRRTSHITVVLSERKK